MPLQMKLLSRLGARETLALELQLTSRQDPPLGGDRWRTLSEFAMSFPGHSARIVAPGGVRRDSGPGGPARGWAARAGSGQGG